MQCRERRQSREMKAGQSEAPRSRMEVVESIQDFLKLPLIKSQRFTFLSLSHIILFYSFEQFLKPDLCSHSHRSQTVNAGWSRRR